MKVADIKIINWNLSEALYKKYKNYNLNVDFKLIDKSRVKKGKLLYTESVKKNKFTSIPY